MPYEVSIGDIYFPGALVLVVLLLPVFGLLDFGLGRVGLYRRALHPSLVRVALFASLYCAALLLFLPPFS
ncbi:hypothetical protein ARC78_05335 [Stenotrophomonas pictorum JCM 9942]|jgi:hypothetical protein|uniref:DUF1656 domain-containing protein n=1 Tax=Stenotrophomonas pictorum JCM 9942 TaxID=1236960 RepID=A0A0R0AJF4_9GAMM|nr:DUF1656 domain-containing protein [Stenotrophomonas pictorum]KRG44569.1 hypothetical protein ARC78_05335 [Stenotrophomonas pictorum JCM 9942]